MSFTKINHYEKEYADTHHECALTVTEGVENQPVVNPYFVRKKKRALTTEEYVEGMQGADGHDHDHEHGSHDDHDDHDHEDGVCPCCGGHHDDDDDDDHDHEHHHHHHADDVFTSWGTETPKKYEKAELDSILKKLSESEDYGKVLRSKGMLPCTDGTWMYFDLVPEEYEIREGSADFTGRICVIGSELKEDALKELFEV